MEKILEAIDTANKIIAEWEWKYRLALRDQINAKTDEYKEKYGKDMRNANLNKTLVMFYRDGLEYSLRCIQEESSLQ